MKDISIKIKAKRKEHGFNQQQLAKLVGVTTSAISQWERGETLPKGENLINLAKALDCKLLWLVSDDDAACEYINIPFYKHVKASAGHGFLCENKIVSEISLPKALFKYCELSGLSAITVNGDSMEPVLTDKALLVLDSNMSNGIRDGSMHVIRQGDLIRVKIVLLFLLNERCGLLQGG